MVRVELPYHLRNLAAVGIEVTLDIAGEVTACAILDELESRYPMLRGTIRDHVSGLRRPLIRFFACQRDVSHQAANAPLPVAIATGAEPFLVVGSIAGG